MKTMKKIIPAILLFALVAVSCSRAELQRVNQENEQLKEQLASHDANMENFMEVFNDIGDNLADIRTREKMIVKKGDNVLYGKYAGTEVEVGGETLLIMRQSDILAIIENK